MPPVEPGPGASRPGILISVDTLFEEGVDPPQPLEDARAAIERLGWIGEPVVVIGDQIGGRRLPFEPQDRVTWVRSHLDLPDVAAVVVDEPDADHPTEDLERAATERWAMLRSEWHADRLVTSRDSSVGPARRAGLIVVRIGPRDPASAPSVERADHEARDLLDAVSRLMTADVFGEAPVGEAPDR